MLLVNQTPSYLLILVLILPLISSVKIQETSRRATNSADFSEQEIQSSSGNSRDANDDDEPGQVDRQVDGCRTNPGDPDTIRNVRQIIESRGYRALEYDIITQDGYILGIQRIINPLISRQVRQQLRPVLLQHGLMSSAADWVLNSDPQQHRPSVTTGDGPGSNALGFYLADRGYDVFLANSRGNIYSQRHVNLSSTGDSKFWDFCFDEKIQYDLPATLEFVRRLTGHRKLAYVGHSQGAAMMLGLMSERPEWARVVEPFVALAPVAFVNNAISPLRHLDFLTPYLAHRARPFTTNRELIDLMAARVCSREIVVRDLCKNFIFLMMGFNEPELDTRRIPAILCHTPAGTSFRNLAHYGQEIRSGRFARFDWGPGGNLRKYGRPEAPDYRLANIRSRSLALFTADNDWLASPKDIAHLRRELPPHALINVSQWMPTWNHIDFLYGKHAGLIINPRVHHHIAQFALANN